ncbi:DegT/DnrJ/EryC1/StrS aminotransferase family protein [Methylophilaceae bacterium]|nr:DegT/DnrJ/EryC1/StrS aminotransferase family protein [Methylophilaceae bacterium]
MNKYPLMRNNISRDDLDAVINHLKKDDPILTNGPYVRQFEKEWSNWLGCKHSVFVNSGASANLLSMTLLKIDNPDGGEIIVPPLTWISDISSVIQNGFTPVFADIDPRTLGLDTKKTIEKISPKTKGIFITHCQGFNALTDELVLYLDKNKIPLIEDVCESHGAKHGNKKAGSIGLMSNFSFYYAHHMSTIEGGMICTDNDEIYQKLRILRSHGMVRESQDEALKNDYIDNNPDLNPQFIFAYPAYNLRNNEIGAIMGINQLKRLDNNVKVRNENLFTFLELINEKKFFIDFDLNGCSNYAFNLVIKEPDEDFAIKLMNEMTSKGIEYRRGSAGGGNQLRQPYLKPLFPKNYYENFKETEHIHFYGFYLGNYPSLPKNDIKDICKVINSV